MFDILALGELLIDFTLSGDNGRGIALYARNPGGAPANVLAMASILGARTALLAKVGSDSLGEYLRDTLRAVGVDSRGIISDQAVSTTLAFVHVDPTGERSFSFYRNPGADNLLMPGDIDASWFGQCGIFHFGSVSLSAPPLRETTLWAAETARRAGAVISFDPNYRPLLWRGEADAKQWIRGAMRLADVVKISEEELELSTGYAVPESAAAALLDAGASAVVVSLGARGSLVCTQAVLVYADTFPVNVVDTTGAGDAFWGAILFLLRGRTIHEIRDISADGWKDILLFANAAGALTTTASGAIPALPKVDSIIHLVGGSMTSNFLNK